MALATKLPSNGSSAQTCEAPLSSGQRLSGAKELTYLDVAYALIATFYNGTFSLFTSRLFFSFDDKALPKDGLLLNKRICSFKS